MTSLSARGLGIAGRLDTVDLDLSGGQMIAIVGPNGGGKTSLVRALAGVEGADGCVAINGEALATVSEARRRKLMGFMPASRDLQWPIPVDDMIGMALDRKSPGRIAELIELFDLGRLVMRPVDELSTGERARVIFARTLAARPSVLLLDEPLSNLEPYWTLRFLEIMREEARRGALLLVSLHDLICLPDFDRAILVAEGAVHEDETPADLLASGRFNDAFRVYHANGRWQIIR